MSADHRSREDVRDEVLEDVWVTDAWAYLKQPKHLRTALAERLADALDSAHPAPALNPDNVFEKALVHLFNHGFRFQGPPSGPPDEEPRYGRVVREDMPALVNRVEPTLLTRTPAGAVHDDAAKDLVYTVLWALTDLGYDVVKRDAPGPAR